MSTHENAPFGWDENKIINFQKKTIVVLASGFCVLFAALLCVLIVSQKGRDSKNADGNTEIYSASTAAENGEFASGSIELSNPEDGTEAYSALLTAKGGEITSGSNPASKQTSTKKVNTTSKNLSGLIEKNVLCRLKPSPWLEFQLMVDLSSGGDGIYITFAQGHFEYYPQSGMEPNLLSFTNIGIYARYENGVYKFDGKCEETSDTEEGYLAGTLKKENDIYYLHLDRYEVTCSDNIYTFPLDFKFKEGISDISSSYPRITEYEGDWSNEEQSIDDWDNHLFYAMGIDRLDSRYVVFSISQIRAWGAPSFVGYKQTDGSYKFTCVNPSVSGFGTLTLENDTVVLNFDYYESRDYNTNCSLKTNTDIIFERDDFSQWDEEE